MNKDKQIAFLAFFKGLCDLNSGKGNEEIEGIWKKSHELVKALEAIYPQETITPSFQQQINKPQQTQTSFQKAPNCDSCGNVMKFVKAGISKKTGKAYKAFWSCPEKGHPTKQYYPESYKAKSEFEDDFLDEASHREIPVLEDEY